MQKYSHIFDTTQLEKNLKGRTVRAGVYSIAAEIANQILRVGAIVALARLLMPEHFGLVSMVTALTVFAERFKHLGLSTVTIQQKTITHEQVSTLFWVNTAAGGGIALLITAASWGIAAFYHEPRLVLISMALSLSFLVSGMNVQHEALLRRQMRFRELGAIQIVANFLSIGLAIVLALDGYTYWALVWKEVTRPVVELVGVWTVCRWWPGLPRRNSGVRSLLKVGGNIASVDMVYFISQNMGQVLLGKFSGAYALGLYRQATQLISLPISQICYPIGNVTLPSLSVLQDQPEQYRRYFQKVVGLVFFVAAPLVVCLAMFPNDIVRLVLGAQWIEASEIFRVLAIGALIEPLFSVCSMVMITRRRTDLLFRWAVLYGCMSVVGFSIGVYWGAFGVACGYAVANYLLVAPSLIIGLKGSPVSIGLFFQAVSKPILFSMIMAVFLGVFAHSTESWQSLGRLIAAVLVAITTYGALWIGYPSARAKLFEDITSLVSGLKPMGKST